MATKHVCDRCGEEHDWKDLIKIEAEVRNDDTGLINYVRHELCKTCYEGFLNFLHDFDEVLSTTQEKEKNE